MSRRIMLKILSLLMVCFLHITASWCIEVNLTSKPVSCNGGSDGEIVATISGSSNEYSIRLVHASNNKLISKKQFYSDTIITFPDLSALDYIVHLVSMGNLTENPIHVTEPNPLKANKIEIVKNPTSEDSCDGEVKIIASGGNPPYSYKWSENTGNSTQEHLENLCPGIYRCFIQDINKCKQADATVFLTNQEKNK